MKNYCLVCEREIPERKELCQNCLDFFIWKYKQGFDKEIGKFRWIKDYLEEWRSQENEKEVEE